MDAVSLKGLERVISVTIGGDSTIESETSKLDLESAAGGAVQEKGKEVANLMNTGAGAKGGREEYDEDKKLPLVHFRTYQLSFKRSGLPTPIAALAPHGPHFTFTMRRSQLPASEMWKAALKKTVKKSTNGPKKSKNRDVDAMGDQVGRVYVDNQTMDYQTRKMRGLRVKPEEKAAKKAAAEAVAGSAPEMDFELTEVAGKVGGGEGRKRARLE